MLKMKIYNSFAEMESSCYGGAIALGTFDGLHVGHRKIIYGALASGIRPVGIVTFANHPLSVIAPEQEPPQLVSPAERRKLLGEQGIDFLLELTFTGQLAHQPPESFVKDLLKALRPRVILVGENFTFGAGGRGTADTLASCVAEVSAGLTGQTCQVVKVPLICTEDGAVVSSTRIRQAVQGGKVLEAAFLLGRPFTMEGSVVHGDQQGRTIGFPTANLALEERLAVPANGAYAVYAAIAGENGRLPGIAAITSKPTAGGRERRLEVHLLDFAGDIYGKNLQVSFVDRLRAERRFNSFEELKAQLEQDKLRAKKILK